MFLSLFFNSMKHDVFGVLSFVQRFSPKSWETSPTTQFLCPRKVHVDYPHTLQVITSSEVDTCSTCDTHHIFHYNDNKQTILRTCEKGCSFLKLDMEQTQEDRKMQKEVEEEVRSKRRCLSRDIDCPCVDIEDVRNPLLSLDIDMYMAQRSRDIASWHIVGAMVRDKIVPLGSKVVFLRGEEDHSVDTWTFAVDLARECSHCRHDSLIFKFERKKMLLIAMCWRLVECRGSRNTFDLPVDIDLDSWIVQRRHDEDRRIRRIQEESRLRQDGMTIDEAEKQSSIAFQAQKRLVQENWMMPGVRVTGVSEAPVRGDDGESVFYINFPWETRVRCPSCQDRFLFFSVNMFRNIMSRTCPNMHCEHHRWKRHGFATVCTFYQDLQS